MTLMQILIECENKLGWIPDVGRGRDIHQARAITHRVVSIALSKRLYSVDDLALALAYCKRKRQPINHPLQLIPLIAEARTLAGPKARPIGLDIRQGEAIAWEQQRQDDDSSYWIGRIVNSLNAGLEDVLAEWTAAGRG
jgi:hypothetical protein